LHFFSISDDHVEPTTLKQAQMFKNGTLRLVGLIIFINND
jgi:hypothetical protein